MPDYNLTIGDLRLKYEELCIMFSVRELFGLWYELLYSAFFSLRLNYRCTGFVCIFFFFFLILGLLPSF